MSNPLRDMLAFLLLLITIGCHSAKTTTVYSGDISVSIENKRADVPSFERVYISQITPAVSMTVKIKYYWRGEELYKTGELTQKDGKWVLFDPDSPADKILDQDILAAVQAHLAVIYRIDKEYRDGKPSVFTDENGTVWRRVNDK